MMRVMLDSPTWSRKEKQLSELLLSLINAMIKLTVLFLPQSSKTEVITRENIEQAKH